jgi:hypothetical protein
LSALRSGAYQADRRRGTIGSAEGPRGAPPGAGGNRGRYAGVPARPSTSLHGLFPRLLGEVAWTMAGKCGRALSRAPSRRGARGRGGTLVPVAPPGDAVSGSCAEGKRALPQVPRFGHGGPSRLTIKYRDSRLTLMRSGEAAANGPPGSTAARTVDARGFSGTTRTVAVRREGVVSVLWSRRQSAGGAGPELGQKGRGRVGRWGLGPPPNAEPPRSRTRYTVPSAVSAWNISGLVSIAQ